MFPVFFGKPLSPVHDVKDACYLKRVTFPTNQHVNTKGLTSKHLPSILKLTEERAGKTKLKNIGDFQMTQRSEMF